MEHTNIGIKHHLSTPAVCRESIQIKTDPDDFIVHEVPDDNPLMFEPLLDLEQFQQSRAIYETIPESVPKDERKCFYDATRYYPFKKLQIKDGKFSITDSDHEIFICTLLKRNLNTTDAASIIARRLNITRQSVQFSGTKDRRAITFQEVSINCEFSALFNYAYSLSKNPELRNKKYGYTEEIEQANQRVYEELRNHMEIHEEQIDDRLMLFNIRKGSSLRLGNLKGNFFQITMHDVGVNVYAPQHFINYFGEQRFGMYLNNHLIGKMLLEKDYDGALKLIRADLAGAKRKLSRFEYSVSKSQEENIPAKKIFDKLDRLSRMMYMHAFQSYEFNLSVNERLEKGTWCKGDKIFVDGQYYDPEPTTPLTDIYLPLAVHNDKFLKGGYRRMIEEVGAFSHKKMEDGVILEFYLPKSSYATMALREIIGCNRVGNANIVAE